MGYFHKKGEIVKSKTVLSIFSSDKGAQIVFGAVGCMVLLVSILNLFVPAGSSLHVSAFVVTILGKYLCYALLALSLDLLWGYLGVLSLGQGVFFALGGYAFAMYLTREIGDRGVYGNPNLPDFMVFMNLHELPWFWYGFDNPLFAILMALLVPGFLAYLFGYFAFKSRVNGVYLSIITQALTYAFMLAFYRNDMGFGGNNGLTDFKDIFGLSLQSDGVRVGLLIVTFLVLFGSYLLCKFIINSRLGRVVISIRDEESRVRFLGYDVLKYKLFIFVVSALIAGVAGALYVPQVGIINPNLFSPLFSIEIVIWVAIGGRSTLYGAVIGAIFISFASTYFTSALPEIWQYVLGGLFVVVTLYLPKGIVGLVKKMKKGVKNETITA